MALRPLVRLFIAALMFSALPLASAADKRPNILFIASDDMNAWVHRYPDKPKPLTPNLDALSKRGVTFQKAYCASPSCNPSRAALMSGLRPSTSSVYDNNIDWRRLITSDQVMNVTFMKAGYDVIGCGKIYHGGMHREEDWTAYGKEKGGEPKPAKSKSPGVGGITFAPLDCNDEDMVDYKTVSYAIEQLNSPREKPLFLAVGLHKPHMPWSVPQKYYDMYPLDKITLPKVSDTDLDDVPPAGVRMAKPTGDHKTMLESGRWKEAVQAYLAATTFADAQIGRLLQALDASGKLDNTIIVFWGDHGWHLGEKQHWRKFALWEEATRTPFIWVVPGMTKAGSGSQRTVDFMSMYPTLLDLCQIPRPAHVEGVSIRPLLENPAAEWSTPAVTTYGFGNHAVRSERYRYIRYADGSEELYDHSNDELEWNNLANRPELEKVKAELARYLPTINNQTPKSAYAEEGGRKAKKGEANPKKSKKKKD